VTTDNHLCVFLRVPRIGRVKTRLARDIGAVAAWSFYRSQLARTIRVLDRDRRWRLWRHQPARDRPLQLQRTDERRLQGHRLLAGPSLH